MARIGLTGTMSCGKTTLAKTLGELEQFKDYIIQTERSKYLSNLGIPLNTDSTLPGQFVFLAERASELLQPNIITDRTIWDVCSFTLSAKSISDWEKRTFVESAMRKLSRPGGGPCGRGTRRRPGERDRTRPPPHRFGNVACHARGKAAGHQQLP